MIAFVHPARATAIAGTATSSERRAIPTAWTRSPTERVADTFHVGVRVHLVQRLINARSRPGTSALPSGLGARPVHG